MKIFVAGASGAIGRPLLTQLLQAGHAVTGIARSEAAIAKLKSLGATAAQVDVFDVNALRSALEKAEPEVVIDQLTALPKSPADMAQAAPHDRKLRLEGGGNLHRLASELGVRRYLQQSSGFFLKSEHGLANEDSPLAVDAPGGVGSSTTMYAEIEKRTLNSPLEGIALRYGFFYGPGTWYWTDGAAADMVRNRKTPLVGDGEAVWSFVHVEDAAAATVAALEAEPGIYNITDNDPSPVSRWLPAFAAWVHADPPPHVTVEQATKAAGEEAVYYGTRLVGASNQKAREALGFSPRPLTWLQ